MKTRARLLLCAALLASVGTASAADITEEKAGEMAEEKAEEAVGLLTLQVGGLAGASGSIYLAVYNNDDDWLSDDAFASREIRIEEARSGEFVVTEMTLPVGEYAFTVFYDANDNGELDTNFIGIPKEPIALSNNAKARFGPPKYKDARFELSLEPVLQRITLNSISD